MPKQETLYACSHCDAQYPKWQGQCDECSKWGTIIESGQAKAGAGEAKIAVAGAGLKRISTGIREADNVLGAGIIPGSFILLTGDPGIGKSTLVLQIVSSFQNKVIYIAGEESPDQIALRLNRVSAKKEGIEFITQTLIAPIISAVKKRMPSLLVVDSIQTISDERIASEPGSPSQLRAVCAQFLQLAKETNIPIIAIGHITKEGSFSGPQTLAHAVDVVLYLEGDRLRQYRLLRCSKNRFGPTNQVGVFSMSENGLKEVKNPSEMFLEAGSLCRPGSVVSVVMEGARPFLMEIQALTNKTAYGYPKRAASGFDLSRLELLLAVLQRRAGLKLENQDVFLNVVGGLKVKDPALDLAASLAVASSLSNQSMPEKSVALGEVGLAGEIRPISLFEERVREAKRLGFEKIYGPDSVKDIAGALRILGIHVN